MTGQQLLLDAPAPARGEEGHIRDFRPEQLLRSPPPRGQSGGGDLPRRQGLSAAARGIPAGLPSLRPACAGASQASQAGAFSPASHSQSILILSPSRACAPRSGGWPRPVGAARLGSDSSGLAPRARFKPSPRPMSWAGSALRRLLLLLPSLSLPLVAAPTDENCIYLKETEMLHKVNAHCYCYMQNRRMDLKYIWSTIQVKINSTEMFQFVPISEESNCQNSENVFAFAKCVVQSFWQSETFKETNININQYGEKMCFRIQPLKNTSYAVSVERNMVDKKLFLLFVAGVFLFHFANTLSRSAVFYYSAGVVLGILATLVFLLLTLKRFIPKHSTFWILMSGCWMSSLYFIYYLQEGMKWLWSEYRIYLLGYFFTVGFISFAVCYKHGPLTNERSITLLTWTLQMIAFLLIYFSVTIPEVAYAIIAVILCSKGLHYPVGVICYVGRKIKNLLKSRKSVFRYLTEEEYREQGETETVKALEELRLLCRDPDFPSWLAVSKLHSPHKFANFVLGSPHVSPAELKAHDEQYGLGGSFLEQQLFSTRTESEQDHSATPTEDEDEIQEQNRSENVAFSYNDELF